MKNRIPRWFWLGAAPLLLVASAALLPAADKAKQQLVASHASAASLPLVWPMPPDPPRIRWERQIVQFNDVSSNKKKKKSLFARMAGADEAKEREQQLGRPYGIATDSLGRVYVADYTLGGVVIFDLKERHVEMRRSTPRAPILFPIGVAVDGKDRLFVSDSQGRSITCFSLEGEVLAQFGRQELGRPTGLAIDRKRNYLYVADAKDHRISVFDIEKFTLIRQIGSECTAAREEGRFHTPTNVAVDKLGNLYVTDQLAYRVQVFNPRGRFLRAFGQLGDAPGYFSRPKGIGTDSEGHIYVVDAEFNNLQVFDSEGTPMLFLGTLGREPGQFVLPAGLHVDEHDRVYISEHGGRLQIFQYIPQPATVKRKEVRAAKQ